MDYIISDNREKKRKPLNELSFFKRKDINIIVSNQETKNDIESANVYRFPLNEIYVNEKLFQQRKKAYSQESVNKIINAVKNGTFKIELFDPVLLWRNPRDNRLYILSGHSRTQAFRELSKIYPEFSTIPGKIIDVPENEAIEIARKSNTLSTKETDTERALYYYNKRQEGTPEKEIREEARENEGKDFNRIYAYSFLNPGGIVIEALEALDKGEVQSRSMLQTIAKWIGSARQRFDFLTNAHEREMFTFLTIDGGYGNKAGQFSNENSFIEKLNYLVYRENIKDQPGNPLNLKNIVQKSSFMSDYEKRLKEAEKNLNDAKKELEEKRKKFLRANVQGEKLNNLLQPYNAAVNKYAKELLQMKNQYNQVIDAERSQTSLFSGFGAVTQDDIQNLINEIVLNDMNIFSKVAKSKLLLFGIKKVKTDFVEGSYLKKIGALQAIINARQLDIKQRGWVYDTKDLDETNFIKTYADIDFSKEKPTGLKALFQKAVDKGFFSLSGTDENLGVVIAIIVWIIVITKAVDWYNDIKAWYDSTKAKQNTHLLAADEIYSDLAEIFQDLTPEQQQDVTEYIQDAQKSGWTQGLVKGGIIATLLIGVFALVKRLKRNNKQD